MICPFRFTAFPRLTPVALAAALLAASCLCLGGAGAQTLEAPKHDGALPIAIEADTLDGQAGVSTHAAGSVRMRQGELSLRTDDLTHTLGDNIAHARGAVQIKRNGNVFSGPELTLKLDTLQGQFVRPHFWFARTQAGGHAELIEFLSDKHLRADQASYSSCTPENTPDGAAGEPAWSLKARSVDLNFGTNVGRAVGAVVWFQGVPILAAPVLTFPLNDQRQSGWLPPIPDYDNKSGFEIAQPYYWNIAPNYDATLIPTIATRRGFGLGTEFRYMGAHDVGSVNGYALPDDRLAATSRGMFDFKHQGHVNDASDAPQTSYGMRWRRVSDDNYWKDFPRGLPTITPRLYDSHTNVARQFGASNWGLGNSQATLYGGVQAWQVLRDLDSADDPIQSRVAAPYQRTQLGLLGQGNASNGTVWRMQGEVDHFSNPDLTQMMGTRANFTGQVEQQVTWAGLLFTPRVTVHSTQYNLDQALADGNRDPARSIPTFSLNTGLAMDRPVHLFDRDLTQTLEPRVQYVRTPYVDQSALPLFDSAPRDFNQYAIFAENAYTGVDRIADANQLTLGLTSRLIDDKDGAEALRVGMVQKVLLADQQMNPNGNGPVTRRLSDLLLLASTTVIPNWTLDDTMQLNPQTHYAERIVAGVRYSPGAYRTVSVNYRYTRDASEQLALGWQWPIAGRKPALNLVREQATQANGVNGVSGTAKSPQASGCASSGTLYSVGNLNYSLRERSAGNSLLGFEYDAGCWISRVVAERVKVGSAMPSTRVMFQLELIGLSRIGSNPLATLRDNIPGYRLLNDDRSAQPEARSTPTPTDD